MLRRAVRLCTSGHRAPLFVRCFSNATFQFIAVEKKGAVFLATSMTVGGFLGRVGVITLNRPKALNALCDALVAELNVQLNAFDNDPTIGAIVITGRVHTLTFSLTFS